MSQTARIRNFSIIAHIDHGKSTLADRLLERTGTIETRKMEAQIMDSMELERERGITIKAKAVRMLHRAADGTEYILNLIDTPGHVDFTYEVSRALAACEGALLVVDATQGVEAQTLANCDLAKKVGLKIIPVINKVDLPAADVAGVEEQIFDVLSILEDPVLASAKAGIGVDEVLSAIVRDIPPPTGSPEAPLAALIFDSLYDPYRGVVLYVRVVDGTLEKGKKVSFFSTGQSVTVEEVGFLTPKQVQAEGLSAGEVGYLVCGIKDIHQVRVGDTVMEAAKPLSKPLPGYKEAKPVVFAGVFPVSPADYPDLKAALEKLHLEDSSFQYQVDTSQALGFGYRLGFLGLLHMDIVKERLEREFDLDLIVTSPNVSFLVRKLNSEEWESLDNPAKFPHYGDIAAIREPVVDVTIVLPVAYQENVINLLKDRRGLHKAIEYLSSERMIIRYAMPLAEIVLDFYDKLKSVSKGYASFDYQEAGDREADLVKLEILVHGEPVDALSQIVHKDKAQTMGRALCEKLKELIPRQQFEVALQASVKGRVLARETIPAVRKDVIAKCYGGDITRKRKLLQKQKEGKRKAKQLGRVEIPQEAFLAVLKIER
ncbi:MAG: translation elongation factor 4 [Elusimicrobia bacterium]|nr:translation elongation factor 4 [Elusimicrobiota bacterium]